MNCTGIVSRTQKFQCIALDIKLLRSQSHWVFIREFWLKFCSAEPLTNNLQLLKNLLLISWHQIPEKILDLVKPMHTR